jgi:hypothetical protein
MADGNPGMSSKNPASWKSRKGITESLRLLPDGDCLRTGIRFEQATSLRVADVTTLSMASPVLPQLHKNMPYGCEECARLRVALLRTLDRGNEANWRFLEAAERHDVAALRRYLVEGEVRLQTVRQITHELSLHRAVSAGSRAMFLD